MLLGIPTAQKMMRDRALNEPDSFPVDSWDWLFVVDVDIRV